MTYEQFNKINLPVALRVRRGSMKPRLEIKISEEDFKELRTDVQGIMTGELNDYKPIRIEEGTLEGVPLGHSLIVTPYYSTKIYIILNQ